MKISKFIKLSEPKAAGIIQLNRPEALNAVSTEMYQNLYDITKKFQCEKDIVIIKGLGKIFCCGGDIKQFSMGNPSGIPFMQGSKSAYIVPAKTYDIIFNYKKPFVALIDGLCLGGGATYAISPKYRVATERTVFAMPEAAIGYFPDSGATYFLSRLSNNFGVYIGMTGTRVKGYDNVKVGLATHFIESAKLEQLELELIDCKTHNDVARALEKYSSVPATTGTELDTIMPQISKCFSGATVEEIYKNLKLDGSDWAMNTIKLMNKMSPTSLKVTHRSIKIGRNLSLQDCLRLEDQIVTHHVLKSDLKEGVRAMLVDKDYKPRWDPPTLDEVSEKYVDRFFAPLSHSYVFDFDSNPKHKL